MLNNLVSFEPEEKNVSEFRMNYEKVAITGVSRPTVKFFNTMWLFLSVHYIDISKGCMKIQDMHEPLQMCHFSCEIYVFVMDMLLKLNKFFHLLVLEHAL